LLDFDILSWLIGLLVLIPLLAFLWRRRRDIWVLLTFSLFWLYLLLLVSAVIFPIPLESNFWSEPGQSVVQAVLSRVNLIPFNYLIQFDGAPTAILYEIMDNILLTIPFGFGLNFLVRLKAQHVLWVSLVLGLGLESAQLLISFFVGPYRTVDVTDVILNASGTLLGYTIFRLFTWLWHRGLGAFVDEVAHTPN